MMMVFPQIPKVPQARMIIIGDRFGIAGALVVLAIMIISLVVLPLLGVRHSELLAIIVACHFLRGFPQPTKSCRTAPIAFSGEDDHCI